MNFASRVSGRNVDRCSWEPKGLLCFRSFIAIKFKLASPQFRLICKHTYDILGLQIQSMELLPAPSTGPQYNAAPSLTFEVFCRRRDYVLMSLA